MALGDGVSVPTEVGQTIVATNGSWSTPTRTLSDGGYTFYVKSHSVENPDFTIQTVPIGRVVIATQGPRVASITFNPRQGAFDVTYVTRVGLNYSSLLDPNTYTLQQGSKSIHPTSLSDITVAGESSTRTIAVIFNRGKTKKPGKDILTINASLVSGPRGQQPDGRVPWPLAIG